MQLNLGDKSYDLFESITHATLGDLLAMEKQTKERGTVVSVATVRSYLIDDVIGSKVNFGFVDSEEKITKLAGLIFLCRRHAGEDALVADIDNIILADLTITFEVQDGDTGPKDETASDPDGSAETPA